MKDENNGNAENSPNQFKTIKVSLLTRNGPTFIHMHMFG